MIQRQTSECIRLWGEGCFVPYDCVTLEKSFPSLSLPTDNRGVVLVHVLKDCSEARMRAYIRAENNAQG